MQAMIEILGGGAPENKLLCGKKINRLRTDHFNSKMNIILVNEEVSMKKAFTMAEVLITLGIIGIVVAMTLPSIISKYQNKVLETSLKKAYSALMQAVVYTETDSISNISGSVAGDRNTEFYSKLWGKYNIVKNFNKDSVYGSTNLYSQLGGVKTYNKKNQADVGCPQLPQLMTNDGMAVGGMYNCYANWIVIDINGPYKKPNILGHDIFYFGVDTDKRQIFPLGVNKVHSYWNFSNQNLYCSKNSTDAKNGYGCTIFALQNRCPDDSAKTYWECLP